MERKLVAILATDVVGYSRLMGRDEVGTHGDIAKGKDLIRQTLEIKPDFNDIFWQEMNFFNPHPDSKIRIDLFLAGAAKCGWDLPPRP